MVKAIGLSLLRIATAEERFVTLGMDGFGRLLVVAYHYRGDDEIRVISARLAGPSERRAYQES